jgi:fructoselysine-6-P-deglycase FrlB-like protein
MNETMRREIFAQPDEVRRAIPIVRNEIARLELEPPNRVVAGGCGDSFFASQVAAGFFSSGPMDYLPATALDVCSYLSVGKGDLCIFISISGNTRRTVEAAAVAKHAGARTLAVTCAAQSALEQSCDKSLLLPFTPISRRTPHTLDYTMTVIALAVVAEVLSGREFRWIGDLPSAIAVAIDRAHRDCGAIVSHATEGTRWFFLGGGPGVGVASYGAAKFHEAGGLPAWAAELENFMHGMNFVLEPDDRVCLVAHDPRSRQRSCRVSDSLDAMGIQPWFVLPDGGIEANPGLEVAAEITALVTCAIPLQLMCLEHANHIGLDLEAPRAGRRDGEIYLNAQKMYFAGEAESGRQQERQRQ